jgi:serine palmitoyltransferase
MSTFLSASSVLEEFFYGLLTTSGNGLLSIADYLGVHPVHLALEIFFGLVLIYFVFQKSYKIKQEPERLTDREIDQLVAEWTPSPLVPSLNEYQEWNETTVPTLASAPSAVVELEGGAKVLNFASTNFLGMAENPEIKKTAVAALQTYGCGSCGPRGFYGTMDVHLELEKKIAEFMQTEASIVYSSGFATLASVIPAFSKVYDAIICDQGVTHAVQVGALLSRSKVSYFKHNDVKDLRRVLEDIKKDDAAKKKKVYRKFVIIEGLYHNYGDIAPLPEILKLKEEFHFHLVMDDSLGIGTLGTNGRGSCEYWGVPATKIDILTGNLGHSVGSLGGFGCGNKTVVNHQRLNASGYVFSASSPPYLVSSALRAFSLIQEKPDLLKQLQKNIAAFRKELDGIEESGIVLSPLVEAPIVHLRLAEPSGDRFEDEKTLQAIIDDALTQGILLTRSQYVHSEKFLPPPSIRVTVCSTHKEQDVVKAARIIKECAAKVLSGKH